MAKIKINKLPKGFELQDGKIVETKVMKDGGMYVTGDQADYGLVTTPQEYYGGTSFNNEKDQDVRYTLSKVPRDVANVEAEGGETVLTDLNSDGSFGLYDIRGPRHSQGGVPMFLPEQSFIYSDTPKLKFTKDEMKEFDMGGQRKTPAQISKKFPVNGYYGEINSEYADDISTRSAELMIKKNLNDLSKLGFMQESKKNFDDGVPLVSHPYLMSQGIDPMEFTAQVEDISIQQARLGYEQQLPMEQQNMLRMLRQMMAQQDQAQQVVQNTDNTPNMSQGQEDLAQADNSMMFGMAKNGLETFIPKFQEAGETVTEEEVIINESPFKNPANIKKYNDAIAAGYVMTYNQTTGEYNFKLAPQGRFPGESNVEQRTASRVRPDSTTTDIYTDEIQAQGELIDESDVAEYRFGSLSGGPRSLRQGRVSGTDRISGSADILLEENKNDFYERWGDIIEAEFGEDGFNYENPSKADILKFQRAAEAERKREAEENNIPYVPYFLEKDSDNYIQGKGFDGDFGLHTFNAPRLNVGFEPGDEFTIKEEPNIDIPEIKIPPIKEKAPKEWWQQDVNNLQALNMFDDNLYLPFSVPLTQPKLDYVLDDPTTIINANLASQATMGDALSAFGRKAVSTSDIAGKTMDANIKAIAGVNSANVNTMNQVGQADAKLKSAYDEANANRVTDLYDKTVIALQNKDNVDNWKTAKANELFNVGATNAANTFNLNSLNDMFKIRGSKYGDVEFTGMGRQPYRNPQKDPNIAFGEAVAEYSRMSGQEPSPAFTEKLYESMVMGAPPSAPYPGMTNAQMQYKQNPNLINYNMLPGMNTPPINPNADDEVEEGGEKLKKFAMNPAFYAGKMGI